MGLNPVQYRFKENESNRLHNGFIAQDIEETLTSMGLTTNDFAAICKWQKVECKNGVDEIILKDQYSYGLRYEELLAPLVKLVQYQQKQIEEIGRKLN